MTERPTCQPTADGHEVPSESYTSNKNGICLDSSDSDSSDSDDEDLKLEGGDGKGHRLVKSNSSNPGVMITKLGRKKLDKVNS